MKASTFVLVPGAWHGAWCWRPVAERLRAAGHRAITLTLPGMADGDDPSGLRLEDAVLYIVDEVRRRNLVDVIFVAHSWGGYPTAAATHVLRGQVSKIVYFNAQVPLRGRSLIDDNPPSQRELMLTLIDESPVGAIEPTLSYVEQIFMQDVAPELQRLVADLLTPQPGRYFLDTLDIDVGTLATPIVYLASTDDRAIQWSASEFAARAGVQPVPVPGTHLSMLTHPDQVAAAILAA